MISPGMSSCEHSLNTLRYADRVKELDASDPAAGEIQAPMYSPPPSRSPNISRNLQDVSMVDDDLAALRSLNEGELSADLYNFHEAVSQLQEQEDEMLDKHKSLLEAGQKWLQKDKQLLAMTKNVDYDQDGNRDQKTCLFVGLQLLALPIAYAFFFVFILPMSGFGHFKIK